MKMVNCEQLYSKHYYDVKSNLESSAAIVVLVGPTYFFQRNALTRKLRIMEHDKLTNNLYWGCIVVYKSQVPAKSTNVFVIKL